MKKASTLLILVLAASAFAACGDDAAPSTGTNTGTSDQSAFAKAHPGSAAYGSPPLEFEADPGGDLAYTTDEVTAKEGNVTIEFTNPQSVRHNVVIEAANGRRAATGTIANGFAATTITLNIWEKFIFYCSVPGHRKAGMEGIVRVQKRR